MDIERRNKIIDALMKKIDEMGQDPELNATEVEVLEILRYCVMRLEQTVARRPLN